MTQETRRAVLAQPDLKCRELRSRPPDDPDTDQRFNVAFASLCDRASSNLDPPAGALVRLAIGIQAQERSATSPLAIRTLVRNHLKSKDRRDRLSPDQVQLLTGSTFGLIAWI